MSTREMLSGLRTRWFIVMAGLVAGVAISLGYVTVTPATYVATATSMVSVDTSDDPLEIQAAASASRQLATSYVSLATSSKILNPVIAELNLDLTAEQLAAHLVVGSPVVNGTISAVVKVSATTTSPEDSASLANAVISSLKSAIEKKSSQVEINRFQTASPPTSAASPNKPLAFVLGAFLGLAMGVTVALAYERSRGVVRRRDPATLAVDALVLSELDSRAPSLSLGSEILALSSDESNVFVLSSAGQVEAAPVARRLALDILSQGRSVAVVGIEAGLVGEFGESALEAASLQTLLDTSVSVNGPKFATTTDRVALVTVESIEDREPALMATGARTVLEDLGEAFDIVLVVGTPLNQGLAAIALSKTTAGVLLLTADGHTRKRDYLEAINRLGLYGGRLAAAVIVDEA